MGSIQQEENAPALPKTDFTRVSEGLSLLKPLTRRGKGPGLLVLPHEADPSKPEDPLVVENGLPHPTFKWAEEGYVVAEIRLKAFEEHADPLTAAIEAIFQCDAHDQTRTVGLVAYSPSLWKSTAKLLKSHPEIVGTVLYGDLASTDSLESSPLPSVRHLAGSMPGSVQISSEDGLKTYAYGTCRSFAFATPSSPDFDYSNESVSHTRSLQFLKPLMNGPYFDLEAIWDEHTYYEFVVRSVPNTMATMVQEPYVNHTPTLTGGVGRERLTDFYANHFIHSNPDDTTLSLVSRTLGIDRVVDEFIFSFTHDRVMNWLAPGVPPTGRKAEVPFFAVVNVRGDRLYHEHISWDQGTVLKQLGLLPEFLPWPSQIKVEGRESSSNLEYQLPVSGVEAAEKMRDKNAVESNLMFQGHLRESNRPH